MALEGTGMSGRGAGGPTERCNGGGETKRTGHTEEGSRGELEKRGRFSVVCLVGLLVVSGEEKNRAAKKNVKNLLKRFLYLLRIL